MLRGGESDHLLTAIRYLTAPPISEDDLETLIGCDGALSGSRLVQDRNLRDRVLGAVVAVLDHRRFPWLRDRRLPTRAERGAAVISTAALLASSRIQTERRNKAKAEQEARVKASLAARGFEEVDTPRSIRNFQQANVPRAGQFCGETMLAGKKADVVVSLWDGRYMAIECKVSNSALNSVKRINDVVDKATRWLDRLGADNVIPAAVLSGVYGLATLVDAQQLSGLRFFWAHRLADLATFAAGTLASGQRPARRWADRQGPVL